MINKKGDDLTNKRKPQRMHRKPKVHRKKTIWDYFLGR